MSKTQTVEALLESAMRAFSRDGYEGSSLREIARAADVPLSTIHFYFRSKSDLYAAVRRIAWTEIDEERTAYLEQALSADPAGPPSLRRLIYAIAFPIVRRALSQHTRDIDQINVLRSYSSQWHAGVDSAALKLAGRSLEGADRSMIRWIDATSRLYPALPRSTIVWGFSFVLGAIYSWQIIDRRYDRLLGPDAQRSTDEVMEDLLAFCVQGFESVARRNSPE